MQRREKEDRSIINLVLLLALATTPMAATLVVSNSTLAQSTDNTPSFPLPKSIPTGTTVRIDGSSSMAAINQSLKDSFEKQYSGTKVEAASTGTDAALKALQAGKIDLAAIGRGLTKEEESQGLEQIRVGRAKIAILVGKNNPFKGNLTDRQFAKIFRGEITNWSQVGSAQGKIKLIDLPATSDTREAFRNYPVFNGTITTGANANHVTEDSVAAVVKQLGDDGIGYAIANQVSKLPDVRVLKMYQTLPDDPAYPFSQPLLYVYKKNPSPAVAGFLGFATEKPGQQAIKDGQAAEAEAIAQTLSQNTTTPTTETSPAIAANADANSISPSPVEANNSATTSATETSPTPGAINSSINPTSETTPTAETSPASNAGIAKEEISPWWWLLPVVALGGLFLWWLLGKRRPKKEEADSLPPNPNSPIEGNPNPEIVGSANNTLNDTHNGVAVAAAATGLGATLGSKLSDNTEIAVNNTNKINDTTGIAPPESSQMGLDLNAPAAVVDHSYLQAIQPTDEVASIAPSVKLPEPTVETGKVDTGLYLDAPAAVVNTSYPQLPNVVASDVTSHQAATPLPPLPDVWEEVSDTQAQSNVEAEVLNSPQPVTDSVAEISTAQPKVEAEVTDSQQPMTDTVAEISRPKVQIIDSRTPIVDTAEEIPTPLDSPLDNSQGIADTVEEIPAESNWAENITPAAGTAVAGGAAFGLWSTLSHQKENASPQTQVPLPSPEVTSTDAIAQKAQLVTPLPQSVEEKQPLTTVTSPELPTVTVTPFGVAPEKIKNVEEKPLNTPTVEGVVTVIPSNITSSSPQLVDIDKQSTEHPPEKQSNQLKNIAALGTAVLGASGASALWSKFFRSDSTETPSSEIPTSTQAPDIEEDLSNITPHPVEELTTQSTAEVEHTTQTPDVEEDLSNITPHPVEELTTQPTAEVTQETPEAQSNIAALGSAALAGGGAAALWSSFHRNEFNESSVEEVPTAEESSIQLPNITESELDIVANAAEPHNEIAEALPEIKHPEISSPQQNVVGVSSVAAHEATAWDVIYGIHDGTEEIKKSVTEDTVKKNETLESSIKITPRTPKWAYVSWNIHPEQKENLRQQGASQLMLQLYDATDTHLNSRPPQFVQQYECEETICDRYIAIPASDRDYLAEIGYLTKDNQWLMVAQSPIARIVNHSQEEFWFEADAELIIHGATNPNSTVNIGGHPIKLKPDGTFHLRIPFSKELLDYLISATTAQGDSKTIHMQFSQKTPE